MPTNVLERIYKLLAKINMGILDGRFDPNRFADILQAFLENKWKRDGDCVTLSQAIDILGRGKVFTDKRVAKAMGMKAPKETGKLPSEEILRQCAEENRNGQDWRVIYCFGLSLRALREKFGTDENKQPCFDKDNTWWLESKEDSWATQAPQAGYYLLNFHGQFGNKNWNVQEQEIANLGKEYERCHEAIFAEAILTIFKVTGERIAEDWWHWGSSASSSGLHVDVGHFPSDGFCVGTRWPAYYHPYLRVSLARKFDH